MTDVFTQFLIRGTNRHIAAAHTSKTESCRTHNSIVFEFLFSFFFENKFKVLNANKLKILLWVLE